MAALLASVLVLSGCATSRAPTTPVVPVEPPQVTVLRYANVAAAAGDTAAHVLLSLCTSKPPVVDLGTCNVVKSDLLTAKAAVDQIVAEANKVPNTEPWSTARINIAFIAASVGSHATIQDPTLQGDVKAVLDILRQIVGVI